MSFRPRQFLRLVLALSLWDTEVVYHRICNLVVGRINEIDSFLCCWPTLDLCFEFVFSLLDVSRDSVESSTACASTLQVDSTMREYGRQLHTRCTFAHVFRRLVSPTEALYTYKVKISAVPYVEPFSRPCSPNT